MRQVMILSAALFAIAAASSGAQAAGSGKYCLHEFRSGTNCGFQTMAQCEKAKTGHDDSCSLNKEKTTTGSGSSMKPMKK